MDDAPAVLGTAREAYASRTPYGQRLTEHRYRTYWTHTPEGLFTVEVRPDGEFRLEALNPAHERRTGLLTENVAGRPLHDCLPKDAADSISLRYQACVDAARPTVYEEVLELPGGRRHWETSLAPVRDHSGRIAWLLGTARDITERDDLRDALQQSEAKFRMLAETVPDIIFSATARGVADYRNRRYYEYTGVEPGHEPAPLSEVHPTDRKRVARQWPKVQREGLFTCEVRVRAADGGYRWFLVRARHLDTPHGGRWFGVATDVHEVKTAAEAQSRLNDQLEAVLASISDCYYTIDRHWRITRINPQAAAWFGKPPELLLGSDARRTLEYPPGLAAQVTEALASGVTVRGEHAAAYYPGRVIDASVYPAAEGASVFFRDVTEQHDARLEVERAHGLLQSTVDALGAFIAILDCEGVIISVNRAWRQFISDRLPEIPRAGVGLAYMDICSAAQGEEGPEVERGVRAVVEGRRKSFVYTYCFKRSGEPRWYQVKLRRFDHGGEARCVVGHEDITEVVQAHHELRESAERLLDIQEEERRRVAVELHDSTGQHLVALSLALGGLQRLAPETAQTAPLYQDIRASLEEAQRELRVFSYLLHPPYLEEDGLALSLRKFLRGFALRSGLRVRDLIGDDVDAADLAVRRTAFRIVQEAISNVHRHADARTVLVELHVDDRLRLRVSDDGRGFAQAEDDTPAGVGIAGMKARVSQLGGEFSIASAEGGVVVEAVLPLAAA